MTNPETANSQQRMKRINRRKVLHYIYHIPAITRVELTERTHLTQQTITNIVNRLIEERIVVEGKPVASSGGRKPIPLFIHAGELFSVGIDITVQSVRAVLINFHKEVLAEKEYRVSGYRDEHHAFLLAKKALTHVLNELPAVGTLQGIGVSVQGLVDAGTGIVLNAPDLKWMRYPLSERLQSAYNYPVFIENDVNMVAIFENLDGRLKSSVHNMTLKLDEGVGGALVLNKRLFAGSRHAAGEFGHYKVVYDEKAHPCHCGGKGCLTTIASLGGIRKFRGWADHVFQYPEHRPADFDTGMEEMTTAIARMLANTAILFNPDHILLTGKVAEWLREDLQRNVERQLLPLLPEHCREIRLIMPDTVPDYALLAACYVMDRMFGPPSEEMADGSE